MTCPCGRPTGTHSSRCDKCQRDAVLDALGWTEQRAQDEALRAMHRTSNKQKSRIYREGLR